MALPDDDFLIDVLTNVPTAGSTEDWRKFATWFKDRLSHYKALIVENAVAEYAYNRDHQEAESL